MIDFYKNIGSRTSFAEHASRPQLETYFTFAFVRNPWDRIASCYRYLLEKRPRQEIGTVAGFRDFLLQAQAGVSWINGLHAMRSQLDYFTVDLNRLKIDFLGHYEYLNQDLQTLTQNLHIPIAISHLNQSSNYTDDYRRHYDDDMAAIIERKFREEIELFGYCFETAYPGNRQSQALDRLRSL